MAINWKLNCLESRPKSREKAYREKAYKAMEITSDHIRSCFEGV